MNAGIPEKQLSAEVIDKKVVQSVNSIHNKQDNY